MKSFFELREAASVNSADKKPETYIGPDGKPKIRMVPVVRKIIKTEQAEDDMPASQDEKSMALDQAKFLKYVGEEITEYLNKNKEFPEWMQNKLSGLHEKAKDMHAVLAGDYEDDEDEDKEDDEKEMKEAKLYGPGHIGSIQRMLDKERQTKKYTKPTQAEIDADKKKDQLGKSRPSMTAKGITNKQYGGMKVGLKTEENIDEAAPKLKGDFIKMQRQKDAEHAKGMGVSVKTGRKLPTKTMTSTQRSLAQMRGNK